MNRYLRLSLLAMAEDLTKPSGPVRVQNLR
jgi:hypothetical protein